MANKELTRKFGVYGGNLLVRPLANLIEPTLNLGNPQGAIFYGLLDIFRKATPKIKGNKYIRLVEAGGFGFYAFKTVKNLLDFAEGDFYSLLDLPFNASMAYEIGKNTFEDYKGENLKKDIKNIPDDLIFVRKKK